MSGKKNVPQKSLDNLILYKKGDNTGKAESGRKGGIKSGETKRRRKALREELEAILAMDVVTKEGTKTNIQGNILFALIREATKGNVRAFEVIRDTVGEKPRDESRVVFEGTGDLSVNLDLVKAMENHFNNGDETDK